MAKTDEQPYFIRSGDGRVFGPVDLPMLVAWARESRIEPSFAVSRDRTVWESAPRLAALEMDWLVETDPGTFYGPFHRAVVDQLRANGRLPATARLYRFDGAAPTAAPPAADPACARLAADCARLTAERDRLAAGRDDLAAERDRLKAACGTLAAERDRLKEDHAALTGERDRLQDAQARLTHELEAKEIAVSELETQAAKQAETTRQTMAFMEAKLSDLSAAKAEADRAAAADLAAAREEIYRGRERAEQAEARVDEAETLRRAAETEAQAALAEKEVLEKRLAVSETELADVRAQLAAVTRLTRPAEPPAPAVPPPLQPEIVVTDVPHKAAPRFPGKGAPGGLAALEAAAARELAAAKKQGLTIGGLFGGRK